MGCVMQEKRQQVEDVVNELCAKGIIRWATTTWEHHNRDGTVWSTKLKSAAQHW
jgi:hypothetical protein